MSLTLSGSGTIGGLVAGGLPDGTVLPADLSTGGPTWDTSGNLGLGVTPSAWYVASANARTFQINNAGLYADAGNSVFLSSNYLFGTSGSETFIANGYANKFLINSGQFRWLTSTTNNVSGGGTSATMTQSMTLDSSGNLLVGTATALDGGTYRLQIKHDGERGIITSATGTTTNYSMVFQNGNGTVGSISTNGSTTTYATSSDYRLKEDYQPVADAIVRLNQLKPVNFAWKTDGTRCDGFLAHELQEVIPEAATGTKDETKVEEYEVSPKVEATFDEEGNELTPAVEAVMGEREVPVYQGIDQSKIVPLLTAALQEAVAKIESLTEQVQELKADITALKGVQ